MNSKIRWRWVWCWLLMSAPLAQCATLQTPYSFSAAPVYSHAGLVQGSDGCLYGTSVNGGTHGGNYGGFGTVFKVTTNGTLSILFSFDSILGANPQAGLVQGSDGNLYGTTQNGGANGNIYNYVGYGTAFKVTTNGALTSLCSFTDANIVPGQNPSGFPVSGLVQGSDGNFYGTRSGGGANGGGTVFMVTSNGAFTILASFANTNGANPSGELVQGGDGNFYGTTVNGGDYGYGTVFRMSTNGTLTALASFTSTNGSNPYGALVQGNDGCFYGTTFSGGAYSNIFEDDSSPPQYVHGYGTVFKVTTNGTLTTLVVFALTNGASPYTGLVKGADGSFYGTTYAGGAYSYQPYYINSWMNGYGTVFRVTTNGTLTTLHSFGSATHGPGVPFDGGNPYGGLVQGTDGNLYGTTYNGGNCDFGTVFMLTTNGTFTTLASLALNPQGANPYSGLVQGSDGNFYGTTVNGGTNGDQNNGFGTVFQVTSNGVLTSLVSFAGTNGANPNGGLVQSSDGSFYGTTANGGLHADGTIFRVAGNGTLTPLYSFAGSDGANPYAALVQGSDGNFYGTTVNGGSNGYGTVFMVTSNGALTTLVSFANTNGAGPYGSLIQGSDGNFYGTTSSGGTNGGGGTEFMITTNGALTMLKSFTKTFAPGTTIWIYPDGGGPEGGLVQGNDGNLYGTTTAGGDNSYLDSFGTVFQMTTNGVFTNLVVFGGSRGEIPYAGLIQGSDGNFYGTTYQGGPVHSVSKPGICSCNLSYGTMFQVTTNGTLTDLVLFANSDGANPYAGLVLGTDGNLYGTTYRGGANAVPTYRGGNADSLDDGYGTVFRVILAPTIFSQPTNQTVPVQGNATFAVGASGFGTLTYQWRKNGANIAGATNSSLSLSNVTVASAANYSVTISNPGGTVVSSNATLTVVCPTITVSPATLPTATVGTAYSQTIVVSGGVAPYTFALTGGERPPGLVLSNNGVLFGTPIASGNYSFTVRATDFNGCTGTNNYNLAVTCPPITLGMLPTATVAMAYNQTNIASGGFAPYTFGITGGSLPPGLVLSSGGVLSGTPTNSGNFSFVLRATDIHGCRGTNSYNLAVACPAITVGPAILPFPRIGTAYNETNTANGGNAPYTFALWSGSLPPGFLLSSNGVLSGTATNIGNYSFTLMVTDVYGCSGSQSETLALGMLLVNPLVDSNGMFSAQVVGPVGSSFVVLATTNVVQPLSNWTSLTTNSAPSGVFSFTDTNSVATNNRLQRFYRVRLAP